MQASLNPFSKSAIEYHICNIFTSHNAAVFYPGLTLPLSVAYNSETAWALETQALEFWGKSLSEVFHCDEFSPILSMLFCC